MYTRDDLGTIDTIFGTWDDGPTGNFDRGDDIIDVSALFEVDDFFPAAEQDEISDFIDVVDDGSGGQFVLVDLDGGFDDFGFVTFIHFTQESGLVGFQTVGSLFGGTVYQEIT